MEKKSSNKKVGNIFRTTQNVLVDDYSINGIPMGLRQRMVLDNADSYLTAIEIMNQHKVCGKNFLITDGNIPLSVVLEQDANDAYISTWNDELEDVYPSEIINNVLRRSNFFLNKSIAGLEDDCYHKSTFLRFMLNFFGVKTGCNYYYTILHFSVLSEEIKKNWGNIDHNLSIGILRKVYRGNTNFFYGLINALGGGYSNSWSQTAYCPETGDILISFAKNGKTTFRLEVNRLNFDELINNFN